MPWSLSEEGCSVAEDREADVSFELHVPSPHKLSKFSKWLVFRRRKLGKGGGCANVVMSMHA